MDPLMELAARLGAEHIEEAPERHVGWRAEAAELRRALGPELTLDGEDAEAVVRDIAVRAEPSGPDACALSAVRPRRAWSRPRSSASWSASRACRRSSRRRQAT